MKFPWLPAGNHHFRQVLPEGYVQTLPASGTAIDLTLNDGDAGDEDFADPPTSPVGFIRGSIFSTGQIIAGRDFGNAPEAPLQRFISGARSGRDGEVQRMITLI